MQDRAALLRLLEWQTAMGADDAVLNASRDRMQPGPKPVERSTATDRPASVSAAPAATTPQSMTLTSARELAEAAKDLAQLRAAVESFDGC